MRDASLGTVANITHDVVTTFAYLHNERIVVYELHVYNVTFCDIFKRINSYLLSQLRIVLDDIIVVSGN